MIDETSMEQLRKRTEPSYSQPSNPQKNTFPSQPSSGPNPYEEKFHSEFSFISLICGVFGLILPLFSTLAIIFGIAGLMQTHREHMLGRWMAITGIVLGFLGIILIIVAILFGIDFLENNLLRMGSIETLIGEGYKFVK
ncbi:MAG TPA: DUF4190 domain-containing protein [Candidatus Nanoarchaeia archaeon]|nr:DUF4190 domain-containing protein [Candidatus Nanoarchaeia archaeon]